MAKPTSFDVVLNKKMREVDQLGRRLTEIQTVFDKTKLHWTEWIWPTLGLDETECMQSCISAHVPIQQTNSACQYGQTPAG